MEAAQGWIQGKIRDKGSQVSIFSGTLTEAGSNSRAKPLQGILILTAPRN